MALRRGLYLDAPVWAVITDAADAGECSAIGDNLVDVGAKGVVAGRVVARERIVGSGTEAALERFRGESYVIGYGESGCDDSEKPDPEPRSR